MAPRSLRASIVRRALWCLMVPLLHNVLLGLAARGEDVAASHKSMGRQNAVDSIQSTAATIFHRALSQAPGAQGNSRWIDEKVQAITDMIITVREAVDNSSTTSTAALPAAPEGSLQGNMAADMGDPNNSSSLQPDAHGLSEHNNTADPSTGRTGSPVDNSSSNSNSSNSSSSTSEINRDPDVLSEAAAPVTSAANQMSSTSNRSISSSTGHMAAGTDSNGTVSSNFSTLAGNISGVSLNNSAANPTSAAAAAQTAVQLLTLLSDLQPDSNTSPPFNKVNYGDNVFNTSGNMPLAVPVDQIPNLTISRWVLAAWSVTNHSTPLALKTGDAAARRKMLLGNFTQLQPHQVQSAVTANVTVPLLFRGVEWKRPASRALQQAAAEAAGGYTQALVQVAAVRPDYGVTTKEFLKQDVQYSGNGVTDKAVTLSSMAVMDESSSSVPDSSSSSSSQNSNPGRRLYSRKLLQQQQRQHAAPSAARRVSGTVVVEPMMTRVWVQYRRLDASNVTALLAALADAFDTDQRAAPVSFANGSKTTLASDLSWPAGRVNISSSEFGHYTKQLLNIRGARTANSSYAVFLNGLPLVTTNMRLAAAVTESQTSSTAALSTDQLVALWMGNASNIVGPTAASAAPIPAHAKVSWLLTPEVWTQPQAQHIPGLTSQPLSPSSGEGSRSLAPAAIAGIAVSATVATAAVIAGIVVVAVSRMYRQQTAYKAQLDDGDDGTEGSGGDTRRRRRRRHMKPRYLLPEIMPHLQPASSQSAAANVCEDHHDGDLDPDQLRAELRELGDSVTSAARYEQEGSEQDSSDGDEAAAAAAAAGGGGRGNQCTTDDLSEQSAMSATTAEALHISSHTRTSVDDHSRLGVATRILQQQDGQAGTSGSGSNAAATGSNPAAAHDVSTSSDSVQLDELAGSPTATSGRGGWDPEDERGRGNNKTTDHVTAAAAARVLSPTSASLALTGTPSSPWLRLKAGSSRTAALVSPFANHVCADTDADARGNPAVAAIRAAYAKAKSCTGMAGGNQQQTRRIPQLDCLGGASAAGSSDEEAHEPQGVPADPSFVERSATARSAESSSSFASSSSTWSSPAQHLTPTTPQPTSDFLRSHSTWSISSPPAACLTQDSCLEHQAAALAELVSEDIAQAGDAADVQGSSSTASPGPKVPETSPRQADSSNIYQNDSSAMAFRQQMRQSPFARSYNFSDLVESTPESKPSQ